jgi:NADH-quinone oxidoreductase subunit N
MWLPDVYEGATLPATLIISTITKLAAIIFVLRFLIFAFQGLSIDWSLMLILLGVISIFLGNIIAIAQTNIKRMLGFSTVANMGFIAFGLMTTTFQGLQSVLFYMFAYIISLLAAFGLLTLFSTSKYEIASINDLRGFGKTHPVTAAFMAIIMLSMAGLPPTLGFYGKFYIIVAMVHLGFIKLSVFAIIMSLIGAFYYLRIIKVMYFEDGEAHIEFGLPSSLSYSVLGLNTFLLIILGIIPDCLLNYTNLFLN